MAKNNKPQPVKRPDKDVIRDLEFELRKMQYAYKSLQGTLDRTNNKKALLMADLLMEQDAHKRTLAEAEELIQQVQELEEQVEKLTAPIEVKIDPEEAAKAAEPKMNKTNHDAQK